MATSYPKKGKKGSRPGVEVKGSTETMGSPYFFRCEKGGDETRAQQIYENIYGKADKGRRKERTTKGFPVSPRRTIITGS